MFPNIDRFVSYNHIIALYWALSEKAQNFDTVAMVTTYSLWLAEILNDRNY